MEGGIRQTIVVKWPGHVAPGTSSDHIFAFWDFLPTAAEIAGVAPPPGIDGVSVCRHVLSGMLATKAKPAEPPPVRSLYYEFCWLKTIIPDPESDNGPFGGISNATGVRPIVYGDGWVQAVRMADWKGYRTNQVDASFKLFNLKTDIGEYHEISKAHPDVLARILAVMEGPTTRSESEHWPSANASHPQCCGNCFSPGGGGAYCTAGCLGKPPPPPPPLPPPLPPRVTLLEVNGTWVQTEAANQKGAKFLVLADMIINSHNIDRLR